MTYEVKFSNQATRFVKSLQSDIKERVKSKFEEISKDPFRFLEHYEGDYYKIRIGDMRALIDLDNENRIIFVRLFDKRSRIYDKG